METQPKKCNCGQGLNNGTCKNCSRIKMSILLKNGCDDIKYKQPNGQLVNPVWYSNYSKNNTPEKKIIKGMIRRFQKSTMLQFTNVLQFRDNATGTLIYSIRV